MSTPSELAVEIAACLLDRNGLCGRPDFDPSDEMVDGVAALIDAKIGPFVEDGARLRAALNIIPPARLRLLAQYLDLDDSQKGIFGNAVQTDLRILANAVDTLQARAQSPAQEGSE